MSSWKRELCINLIVIGQILDLVSTAYGVSHGKFREANPIIAWVIKRAGLNGAGVLKLLLIYYLTGYKRWAAGPLLAGVSVLPAFNNLLLLMPDTWPR